MICRRFANKLLDKLISYLDTSAMGMKLVKPSSNFTRRNDFKKSSRGVKFFFKVVLPLVEKYFSHHRAYFTAMATATTSAAGNDGICTTNILSTLFLIAILCLGVATIREKEYVATLFCKLANLLRLRQTAFGSDAQQAVKCLQVLIKVRPIPIKCRPRHSGELNSWPT